MRLIPKNRHQHRSRKARIAITEAEISADLHYPAPQREPRRPTDTRRPAR